MTEQQKTLHIVSMSIKLITFFGLMIISGYLLDLAYIVSGGD